MPRTMARLGMVLLLIVPFATGCNFWNSLHRDRTPPPVNPNQKPPDADALVNYLNQNAQRVQSIRAKVSIDAKQGGQSIGLDGLLACQKPRDFRMKGMILGRPAVDVGSNNDEFWYWISQAPDPYVYHCSYDDLSKGQVHLPFPFHPEMVISSLGIQEYDPNGKYELKDYAKTVELIQDATTTSGEKVKQITVFNKFQSATSRGQPQILGYVLQDLNGKAICRATIHKVTIDKTTGAIIPTSVTIDWPAQDMSMKLMLSDVQSNALDQTMASGLFSRRDLTMESFDLARGRRDQVNSVRRAGALMPARR